MVNGWLLIVRDVGSWISPIAIMLQRNWVSINWGWFTKVLILRMLDSLTMNNEFNYYPRVNSRRHHFFGWLSCLKWRFFTSNQGFFAQDHIGSLMDPHPANGHYVQQRTMLPQQFPVAWCFTGLPEALWVPCVRYARDRCTNLGIYHRTRHEVCWCIYRTPGTWWFYC